MSTINEMKSLLENRKVRLYQQKQDAEIAGDITEINNIEEQLFDIEETLKKL